VRVYTAHLSAKGAPELVREGFSFWAMVFGWLWLAVHRAWIAAIIDLVVAVIILATTAGAMRVVLLAALVVLQGIFGNDLRRWGLARRGYILANAVAARDRDAAFARLMSARPELLEQAARGLP
jgi:hypothetical protein